MFAGVAAHSMLRLDRPLTASFGLVLATYAHAVGWPMVRGGADAIATALVAELEAAGGELVTGHRVGSIAELPAARAVLLDVTPRQLVAIAGDRLSARSRRRAERFRYGSGVFKIDWALDGPVPWTAEGPRRAATVHLGGTLEEIAAAEAEVAAGRHADRPFVLFVQYAPWDTSRAPEGKTTAWAYCHVPAGSDVDMTDRIETQVERFAPGFRDRILARSTLGPAAMETYDANYVGGDINGGIQDIRQLVFRPWPARDPLSCGRRALPLLVVDPAGWRRPWDGWIPSGPVGAAPRAPLRRRLARVAGSRVPEDMKKGRQEDGAPSFADGRIRCRRDPVGPAASIRRAHP